MCGWRGVLEGRVGGRVLEGKGTDCGSFRCYGSFISEFIWIK